MNYRFVNMVEKSNFTENEIWKNINYTRFERKKMYPDATLEKSVMLNVEKLSQILGIKNISDEVNGETTKPTIKPLDEMFFSLWEVSSYYEQLYSRTVYGPQSRLIMLASNIVKESPENFKLKAKKIYSKIASIIFKKYHNESFMNRKDISTLKGQIQ